MKGKEILDIINGKEKFSEASGTYWLTESQKDNEKIINSSVLQKLAMDPKILNFVAKYLGVTPTHVATNFWFSAPSIDTYEQERNAQKYHQDGSFISFVKVFIYLTDTDELNGAHFYVAGSNRSKPDTLLENYTQSERIDDRTLEKIFGKKMLRSIQGSAGDLIFADTSCFHKGGVVKKGYRLMMNLEYTSTLFGSGMNYFNCSVNNTLLKGHSKEVTKRIHMNYNKVKHEEYLDYQKSISRLFFQKLNRVKENFLVDEMLRKYGTNVFKEIAKKIAFQYLGIGKPDYPYMLDPIQLSFMIQEIDKLYEKLKRPLHIYEIGVARGMTTAFLASHITFEQLPHKLTCIDTFSGFTNSDLSHEISERGKKKKDLLGFAYNDYHVWLKNFSSFDFVDPIKCDISNYIISKNQDVDIVLADVDLYIPTKNILEKFYKPLSNDGLIVVDDVKENSCWDGAHEAYHEFCRNNKLDPELIGRKCGIIRKANLSS